MFNKRHVIAAFLWSDGENVLQEIAFPLHHLTVTGLTNGRVGRPILLALHGWLDNAASFVPLASYFYDYHLIALDFAGHGKSGHRPSGGHYHQSDYIHDLHELVHAQQWQNINLVGHSMGGIIGAQYTAAFPEQVRRFVTIEAFGPVTKDAQSSATQLRDGVLSRKKQRDSEIRHPQSMQSAAKARAATGQLNMSSAELLMDRNIDQSEAQLRWRTDRRLRTLSPQRMTDAQADAFMSSIACPTLAIRGSEGFDMVRNNLERRESLMQNLQIAVCDGGHHVHMDNPLDVSQRINYFLEQELDK